MDNLTHSLVGAALAKSGLERTTPLALATLVIAANAPDVDVLSYARGPYFALAVRRGVTHGVPALLVLPFAVAGAVAAFDRTVRRRRHPDAPPARFPALLGLAALGVLTHPVLDWMNNYGMRWWLPFDGRWSYGDSLFIIDPWLWLAPGAAVFLSRRWSRPAAAAWLILALLASAVVVGGRVPHAAATVWWVGLATIAAAQAGLARLPAGDAARAELVRGVTVAAALYVGLMVASSAFAKRETRAAAEAAGFGPVEKVMYSPAPADPLRGAVAVLSGDRYLRGSHAWGGHPRVKLALDAPLPVRQGEDGVHPGEIDAAIDAALRSRDAAHYLTWSRMPYFRVAGEDASLRVRISDVRYDQRGGPLGGVEVVVPRGSRAAALPSSLLHGGGSSETSGTTTSAARQDERR